MTKRHAPPPPILAEIVILSGRATIRVNYWFADTWQCRHVGSQNNASFFPPIFIEKSLVHSGGKCFCSCEPTWMSRRQTQTSNTNSTRDCSWQIKLSLRTENWCESNLNGLDFSTVGVLYFLMYITLKNVSGKKKPLPLEERFYSKCISVDLWLVYRPFSACQWLVTSKQTNQNRYRLFIDALSSLVLEKPIITPCFLIKIFALSVTKTDVTGAWAIIF